MTTYDDELITCAICGRRITYARSRLFFGAGGTYRTCSRGTGPHEAPLTRAMAALRARSPLCGTCGDRHSGAAWIAPVGWHDWTAP